MNTSFLMAALTVLAAFLAAGCSPNAPVHPDTFVYEIVLPDGEDAPPAAELRDRTIATLMRRRDAFGWDKITFTPDGNSRIVFGLPTMDAGVQDFVCASLAVPGRFAIRAIPPENEEWLTALAEADLAPEGFANVLLPEGVFWQNLTLSQEPGDWVITNFAARSGFEIRLNFFAHTEHRDLSQPWYVSTVDVLEPAVQSVSRRALPNCDGPVYRVSALLAPADRTAYAALAAEAGTGTPRRLAFCFDHSVWFVTSASQAELRDGIVHLELPGTIGECAEAFLRSGPLPCKLRAVKDTSDSSPG